MNLTPTPYIEHPRDTLGVPVPSDDPLHLQILARSVDVLSVASALPEFGAHPDGAVLIAWAKTNLGAGLE